MTVGIGRFGPYVLHTGKYVSLPKTADPMTATLQDAIKLILEKRQAEAERHLKKFAEEPELEVLNGRYGPYLSYKGQNYRLPKAMAGRAKELTLDECMALIREQDEKPQTHKRTYSRKK